MSNVKEKLDIEKNDIVTDNKGRTGIVYQYFKYHVTFVQENNVCVLVSQDEIAKIDRSWRKK